MDDRRFDAFTRTLGSGASRRTLLRGLIGLGAGAATAPIATSGVHAARRGSSGPTLPSGPTPIPTPPPCAEVGEACGDGCCSGNCCDGVCLAEGVCCTDSDCATSSTCQTFSCKNHTCYSNFDPNCPLSYCSCVWHCYDPDPIAAGICYSLCALELADCPSECRSEMPCVYPPGFPF
jgi:hypothetical protein